MTKLIIKKFIKDYNNVTNENVRFAYGKLSGIVGIISNLFLCLIKVIIGIIVGSISIIADSINNLSDAGSSVVTFIGFKLSSAPADKEHPFGHQRVEYITGLIVSFVILFIGLLLFKSSIENIISPTVLEFNLIAIIILALSILIKLWQSRFYKLSGKRINSNTLIATSQDSINDCVSTSVVLIAYVVAYYTGFNLDGYMGIIVSMFILVSGIQLIKETISPLIGEAPTKEFVEKITEKILSYDGVIGVHDLVIHTYGPAKTFITVHVEVDSKVDIVISHDLIDSIEQDFMQDQSLNVVIHMDPVNLDCEITNKYREMIKSVIKEIDEVLDFHDFRVVKGPTQTKLIFDVALPAEYKKLENELIKEITEKVKKFDKKVKLFITIDKNYIL